MRRKFSKGRKRSIVRSKKPLFGLDFGCFGASFCKNRQKVLSPATESFLCVMWCSKLYQKFPWTLRRIFCMIHERGKCVEKFLRTKMELQYVFKKSFFEHSILSFQCFGATLCKNWQNCFLQTDNHFCVSGDAPNYTKSFLGY